MPLADIAAIFVHKIAVYFLLERMAPVPACVYTVLPASLMQLHELVNEATYDPALIIATYYVIRHVETGARGH